MSTFYQATAYIVGEGIASSSAAVLLIRDGGFRGRNLRIIEGLPDACGGTHRIEDSFSPHVLEQADERSSRPMSADVSTFAPGIATANAIVFPLAAGVLYPFVPNPEVAALSMAGGTVVVAINALMLKGTMRTGIGRQRATASPRAQHRMRAS